MPLTLPLRDTPDGCWNGVNTDRDHFHVAISHSFNR